MTSSASMKAMTAIFPWHMGHVRGSIFPDQVRDRLRFFVSALQRRVNLAQFLRYPLDDSSGCKMEGTNPSSFAFLR